MEVEEQFTKNGDTADKAASHLKGAGINIGETEWEALITPDSCGCEAR